MAFNEFSPAASSTQGRLDMLSRQAQRGGGLDPNLYNQFQANIPGQTVSNINQARSGINQATNLASGTQAGAQRKATQDEMVKSAMQRHRGYQALQQAQSNMDNARMATAAQLAGMANRSALQRESMATQEALNRDQMAQQQTQFEEDLAARKRAATLGMVGNIAGGLTGGIGSLLGGIFSKQQQPNQLFQTGQPLNTQGYSFDTANQGFYPQSQFNQPVPYPTQGYQQNLSNNFIY